MNKNFMALCLSLFGAVSMAAAPPVDARAYLVKDLQSGVVLAQDGQNIRIEPASLTKLMTAYLTFEALKKQQLQKDEMLLPSLKAYRAEGSRMFLEPNQKVSVEDLIKGMIVQSGNDASIVLAERIGGSEEGFAQLMNQKAVALGMNNSHFHNATGLTAPDHYTTVADLALLSAAIQKDFPEYYEIYSIKSFTYNNITQNNRNGLLWQDPFVDGMKTGYTSSAGYNLIASSHRNNRRVIAVVVGTQSAKAREKESARLLAWAMNGFETPKVFAAHQAIQTLPIYKGQENKVSVGLLNDAYVTVEKGQADKVTYQLQIQTPLKAPLKKGDQVGVLVISVQDQVIAKPPVVALHDVSAGNFFKRLWHSIVLWVKGLF